MRGAIALWALTGCQLVFPLRDEQPGDATGDTPPATSLVAHYEMDELPAGILADSAGGHDATCVIGNCPTTATGKIGNALSFEGGNQFLEVPDPGVFQLQTFTIALWTKPILFGGLQCLVTRQFGTGTTDSFALCIDSVNTPFVSTLHDPEGVVETMTVAAQPLGLDPRFVHLAVTWDGSVQRLFVDGVLAGSDAPMSPLLYDGNGIVIGADTDQSNRAFTYMGVLDDLRIYDAALGPEEIVTLAGH